MKFNKTIQIAGHEISDSSSVFIIAEAGVNHNGRLDLAKRLVDVAAKAGADAVKFQTFKTENLILDGIEKAHYQKRTTIASESQTEMIKKLEIDKNFHEALIEHCIKKNIIFLSTPYDEDSLKLLLEFKVPAIKIASTDATNLLFLEKIAKSGKPVILSTGMCSLYEIEQAYRCLQANGCKELAILKCTSNYPTDPSEVNLRAIKTLQICFDTIIGFSDHTEGIGASPYAVAIGAKIVEKHFTLDKNMEGPDHQASLSPDELIQFINEIRKVEKMLGSKEIFPTKTEENTKISLQKYLVAKRDIKKGEIITREKLIAKRTDGKGISASDVYKVLNKKLMIDVNQNQIIYWYNLTE
jgi:N-acetylneuraminate synthase